MIRQTVLFLPCSTFFILTSFAQIEVNVKLNSGNSNLQDFLSQKTDPSPTENIPQSLYRAI